MEHVLHPMQWGHTQPVILGEVVKILFTYLPGSHVATNESPQPLPAI